MMSQAQNHLSEARADAVRANPYSSGAAALVFVCSIIGAVAPSYEVDGIGRRLDPELEVPSLLYIGRKVRVIERATELIDCVPSLLQQIDPSYHPERTIVPWSALISTLVDRVSPCGPPP